MALAYRRRVRGFGSEEKQERSRDKSPVAAVSNDLPNGQPEMVYDTVAFNVPQSPPALYPTHIVHDANGLPAYVLSYACPSVDRADFVDPYAERPDGGSVRPVGAVVISQIEYSVNYGI
jgi:hypothetical protein